MKEAFKVNDTVLAYHGMVIYEAKVIKVDHGQGVVDGGGGEVTPNTQYYVHYQGWSKKWDEWVRHDLVLHDTPANRAVQQKAKEEMDKVKKEKSALARKKKISTAGIDTAGARKSPFKKMKINPDTETEEMPPPEDVNGGAGGRNGTASKPLTVQMPFALKKQLVEDWKQITHEPHKLVPLPRKPNVRQVSTARCWTYMICGDSARIRLCTVLSFTSDGCSCACMDSQIIKTYLEFKKAKVQEGDENQEKEFKNIEGILEGVQAYFDRALGSILLYRMERKQFQDVKSKHEDVPPSEIYGAEHLVRLFGASSLVALVEAVALVAYILPGLGANVLVTLWWPFPVRLPVLLGSTTLPPREISQIQSRLNDFLKFMQKHSATWFVTEYQLASEQAAAASS